MINPIWANEQYNLKQQQLSQSAPNDTLVAGMVTSSLYALIASLGLAYEQ